MTKFTPIALLASVAAIVAAPSVAFAAESSQSVQAVTDAAGQVDLTAGKMLYGANGQRIATIYRVNAEGNPQVILDGRLITVPVSSVSIVDGKVSTSLTKREVARIR